VKIYFIIGVCVIHSSLILANRFHAREILQNVQVIVWGFWGGFFGDFVVVVVFFVLFCFFFFWLEMIFSVSMPGYFPEV